MIIPDKTTKIFISDQNLKLTVFDFFEQRF